MDIRKIIGPAFALLLPCIAACAQPQEPAPEPAGAPAETAAAAFPSGTLVDLSHTFDKTTIFWPTAESFRLDKVAEGMTPDGYYYAANNFFTSEHGGTHLDAPVHFAQGKQSVDQIPLEKLVGAAVVIDVSDASGRDADYQITVQDFERWE